MLRVGLLIGMLGSFGLSGLLLLNALTANHGGAQSKTQPVAPRVSGPETIDFGNLDVSQPVHGRTAKITNNTGEPIELGPISKACSCSEATLSKQKLDPGEEAELTVAWKIAHKRGPSRDDVMLIFNSPTRQYHCAVRLQGVILRPVDLDALQIELSAKNSTRQVALINKTTKPVSILSATANHPVVKVEILPGQQSARVSLNPAETWPLSGQIYVTITTDSLFLESVQVPVSYWR